MSRLSTVLGVVLAIIIGACAACFSEPLSPAEKAALEDSAKACLEAAVRARMDAGVVDSKP